MVARAPFQNEWPRPDFEAATFPTAVSEAPTSKTPKRFKARRKKRNERKTTNAGDWSWKPQPTCWPMDRKARRSPASAQNEAMTPAAKTSPWILVWRGWAPACLMKPRTFRDRTGRTQGMRFRMRPPRNANARAAGNPVVGAGGVGGGGTAASSVTGMSTRTAFPCAQRTPLSRRKGSMRLAASATSRRWREAPG